MEITIRDCWRVFRSRLSLWIALSVAILVVALVCQFFSADRQVVNALVNFSYDGVESGLDPMGNRFDEQEIKGAEQIRAAATNAGLTLSDEDAEAVRDALEVRGVMPKDIFQRMLERRSIYGEDEIETAENMRDDAYFPSQYAIAFRYQRAGLTADEGTRFLQELLAVYERYFYERYGYSASLEQSVSGIDYGEYDYINAVDILGDRLSSLRSYLAGLALKDNTRFVSAQTGYSFSDLLDAIDTIQSEDINWITSYITSNNITKNRQDLIDYYLYRIQDAEREMEQRNSRLYTLTEQIESYVKTNAILLGVSDAQAGSPSVNYEFSQQSAMYDALINEKISCETAISETQERIGLYQQRMERLQSDDATGDSAIVEENLKRIDGKIAQFLADTRQTADEFFKTVWLERAVQVLKEPERASVSMIGLLWSAKLNIVMAEAALFGLFVLLIPKTLRSERSAAARSVSAHSEEETAEAESGLPTEADVL